MSHNPDYDELCHEVRNAVVMMRSAVCMIEGALRRISSAVGLYEGSVNELDPEKKGLDGPEG